MVHPGVCSVSMYNGVSPCFSSPQSETSREYLHRMVSFDTLAQNYILLYIYYISRYVYSEVYVLYLIH